jgi:hypothetical protein
VHQKNGQGKTKVLLVTGQFSQTCYNQVAQYCLADFYRFPSTVNIETDIRPGEFVMRTLFAEFTIQVNELSFTFLLNSKVKLCFKQAEKKINTVMSEPIERPLSKSLQRGEFPQFDQLLSSFGSVAEHCLPSVNKFRS